MRGACFLTTNRAEYSKFKPILQILKTDSNFDVYLLITGSHLLYNYGKTIKDITEFRG